MDNLIALKPLVAKSLDGTAQASVVGNRAWDHRSGSELGVPAQVPAHAPSSRPSSGREALRLRRDLWLTLSLKHIFNTLHLILLRKLFFFHKQKNNTINIKNTTEKYLLFTKDPLI